MSLSSVNYVHASCMMPVPTFGRIKLTGQLNLTCPGENEQLLHQSSISSPDSAASTFQWHILYRSFFFSYFVPMDVGIITRLFKYCKVSHL